MLRILAISICLGLIVTASAQTFSVTDDFDGNSTINTWFGDDCVIDENHPNPLVNDDNPSATVLRYLDVGGSYSNARFTNSFNFNMTTGTVFTLKVYVPSSGVSGTAPNQVSLKLQNGYIEQPWTSQSEIILPIELDQWQELTFDFSSGDHLNFDSGSPVPA